MPTMQRLAKASVASVAERSLAAYRKAMVPCQTKANRA
jgi:hypothetical protein